MKGITRVQWIHLFGTTDLYYRCQLHSLVRKIGPVHIAEPGLIAGGRQADEIQVKLDIFKNHCILKDRYSIITAVEMHSSCFLG